MATGKKSRRGNPVLLLVVIGLVLSFLLASSFGQKENFNLYNLSKKKSATAYMEVADSTLSRMRGLMFRDRIIAILFVFDSDGKWAIHSNFVKSEFDAVYLSSEGKVVEIFRKIPPNTQLISPKKDARYLLELPVDTFDSLSIEVGDKLEWKKI